MKLFEIKSNVYIYFINNFILIKFIIINFSNLIFLLYFKEYIFTIWLIINLIIYFKYYIIFMK